MRVFLSAIILIFSFQTLTKADDIKEVMIEGISIGDSLLERYTREEIKKAANSTKDWFVNKKYTVSIFKKNLETYDKLHIVFLTDDNKYIVKAVSGLIDYPDNISECYKKSENIYTEIKATLTGLKDMGKYEYNHNDDPESKIIDYALLNDNDDEVYIGCYDYSKSYGGLDHLRVGVRLIEFANFLLNDAYK
tara:strand:+ start:626 stop:1201 length:576 start_codon:yes stop_codon:yes gene_type:complete